VDAWNNLGVLYRDTGDVPEALASYVKAVALQPDVRNASQNFLLGLNYVRGGEEAAVCEAHASWGDHFASGLERLPARAGGRSSPGGRLTVGYVSPDLYLHSVSYFAEAPLRWHDPARVRVVVYSVTPRPDAKTALLREAVERAHGAGAWRDAAALTDDALAARVREDGVDVLVELTGHTAHNRLGVMARRPAPVQVTWIGYPNSTGLREVDYRLTDAECDPEDTSQTFVEELVRLPGCFLCYTPAADAPPVARLPALSSGFVTFGSFNALAKVTPAVRSLWARVLRAVPGSRLLVKAKPFVCDAIRGRFVQQMEQEGVDPARVDLLPQQALTRDHLASYSTMDVSLDTFPYAGTTTTCESLFMGVPCLTLGGKCHAHNVGVSLMKAVGLDEFVARSEDDYVRVAQEVAADLSGLGRLREGLRGAMLASPLCDAPRFVRGLEETYEALWARRDEGEE